MYTLFDILVGIPTLAVMVMASADYPSTPTDQTTPTQQRLAISGLNCKFYLDLAVMSRYSRQCH